MSKRGRSKTNAPAVWVEMPSPFSVEPGHIRLRAPAGGFTREHLDRLRSGSLGQPFILERADSRVLFFTPDAVQSAMSTDDPCELLCTYTRKMMSFLLLVPEPQHVLMIGLGGGSIAKFCRGSPICAHVLLTPSTMKAFWYSAPPAPTFTLPR